MAAVRLPLGAIRRLEAQGRLPRKVPHERRPAVASSVRVVDHPATLAYLCRIDGLPAPEREHLGIPGRRFRFDLAWPALMVACEVDGGQWTVGEDGQQGGRHQRPDGFARDCEKLSLAAAHGWRVLRVTPDQIERGDALAWLRLALT